MKTDDAFDGLSKYTSKAVQSKPSDVPDDFVAHATAFCYPDVRFNTFQSNCSLLLVSVVCFFELSMSQYLNVCVAGASSAGHEVSRIDSRPFAQRKNTKEK